MQKTILGFLTAVAVVGAVAGAGAATYAYVNGQVESTLGAPYDKTWSATQAAIQDLEFKVTKTTKDALNAELDAKTAEDKSITIKLSHVSDTATKLTIRVGKFGDKQISDAILDKIKKHLSISSGGAGTSK
jgi:uncharacterized lipoprotein